MSVKYFLQFGLVHYFTKVGSGEYYLEELEDEPCPLVRYLVNIFDDFDDSELLAVILIVLERNCLFVLAPAGLAGVQH